MHELPHLCKLREAYEKAKKEYITAKNEQVVITDATEVLKIINGVTTERARTVSSLSDARVIAAVNWLAGNGQIVKIVAGNDLRQYKWKIVS